MTKAVDRLARDMEIAMREQFFTDPQGRRVHQKYVFPEGRKQLWVHVDYATPDQMQRAFQCRRHQILEELLQLRVDVVSFNENHGADLNIVFDFAEDLMDAETPDDRS